MSTVIAYEENGLRLILADHVHAYRPAPANDDMLTGAQPGKLTITGRPGAWQAFQLILDAQDGAVVTGVHCGGLAAMDGFTCLATEGVDSAGNAFNKPMPVEAGKPWPLWCLIMLDSAGTRGVELSVEVNGKIVKAKMTVCAEGEYDMDAGACDKDQLSRLIWLNSRTGISDAIPAPFKPIELDGRRLKILGREIVLGLDGCPEQIYTHFTGDNSELTEEGRAILARPFGYAVRRGGKALGIVPEKLTFTSVKPHAVNWSAESAGEGVKMRVEGRLEYDGTLTLNAYIRAGEPGIYDVETIHEPVREYSGLFIGMGVNGGKTPAHHEWKWDAEKRQDAYWTGGVTGGLLVKPRDPDMQQSFVNLYYHHGPRNLPVNWVNGGRGGFIMDEGRLSYFSGHIKLNASEKLFGVELMVSPFKTTDHKKHFGTHYYHGGPYKEDRWPKHARDNGCTHINYHHGNDGYPFINYPMYDNRTFMKLIAEAHSYGIGVKPYYTVRELTGRLPEFWAFRSLRSEIYPKPTYKFDGIEFQGGTDDFIKQNLGGDVIPAWKHVFTDGPYAGQTDPSLITNPMSRLANFYVEGLHYMCRKWSIDGIYIDDVGYDRTVMRRVRHVLDHDRPGALIDLHTWNHFEDKNGAGWGHNALLYAQLMPYLDSLWLGEGFDYEHTSAEYILVEISGLPFGLMGEMLQGGGNPWRGMLYGMTNRFPYQEKTPKPIWKLRDRFGFDDVAMRGFWDADNTIGADVPEVKCTVYENRANGDLLVCYANFTGAEAAFTPTGLPEDRHVFFPEVDEMQSAGEYAGGAITLEESGGAILWVRGR